MFISGENFLKLVYFDTQDSHKSFSMGSHPTKRDEVLAAKQGLWKADGKSEQESSERGETRNGRLCEDLK